MLDRARDADRDVELRRDDLAGLADLVVVGHVAGVDRGARGAQRGAELVGERLEELVVVVAAAQATTARDDDLGSAELGALALDDLAADQRGDAQVGRRGDRLDRRGIAARRRRRTRWCAP
ncbi:hypothetical protein MASR2M50_33770 [Thauera sp.]